MDNNISVNIPIVHKLNSLFQFTKVQCANVAHFCICFVVQYVFSDYECSNQPSY